MNRRVIVHSFHSQVYQTLARLDYRPNAVVALDSHLDVHMGTKDVLALMPKYIRLAALRASSHTLIRRVMGELPVFLKAQGLSTNSLPEMFLVVPQVSIDLHVSNQMEFVKEAVLSGAMAADVFREPEETFLKFQSEMWGIKVFASPPRNLLKLMDNLKGSAYALCDLDVDYVNELQNECYTPLRNAKLGDLGWMEQILRFVRKTKPPIITISEAKVSAIRDRTSNFSKLVMRLRNLGYSIEYKVIFPSDDEAERSLKIYQDFYEKIQKPLQERHFAQRGFESWEAVKEQDEELPKAARRYFTSLKEQKSSTRA